MPALGLFRQSEYLSRVQVRALVRKELPELAQVRIARVFLMTHWRYWGFTFNPVSYYFLYAEPESSRRPLPVHTSTSTSNDVNANPDGDEDDLNEDPTHPLGRLLGMISEVSNTPWGEKCWYCHTTEQIMRAGNANANVAAGESLLSTPALSASIPTVRTEAKDSDIAKAAATSEAGDVTLYFDRVRKKMHVSPFFEMHYDYQLHYSEPNHRNFSIRWIMEKLAHSYSESELDKLFGTTKAVAAAGQTTSIPTLPVIPTTERVFAKQSKVPADRIHFKAAMTLTAHSIDQRTLNWILVRYPFMTIRVVVGIYWQAALLYANDKIKFITHPNKNAKLF
jgi:DUF1365 family protein